MPIWDGMRHDLGTLGKLLDEITHNMYVGYRSHLLAELGRQPKNATIFFCKISGTGPCLVKDSWKPEKFPNLFQIIGIRLNAIFPLIHQRNTMPSWGHVNWNGLCQIDVLKNIYLSRNLRLKLNFWKSVHKTLIILQVIDSSSFNMRLFSILSGFVSSVFLLIFGASSVLALIPE